MFKLFVDGDSWCAVQDNFINLMESPAGFGATPEDAVNELIIKTLPEINYWQAAGTFSELKDNLGKDGFGLNIETTRELMKVWATGFYMYGFREIIMRRGRIYTSLLGWLEGL